MKFLSSERLSQHKYKTPEGYLICTDAILARTGKQTYRRNEVFGDSGDDSEIQVDRTPEEVFSPITLASFENKPITVEHPDEDVNAGNHNELSVGFVRDVHRGVAEGQDVMLGTLVITDAQTIEEIENGEHTDLSCGYDCDIKDEVNPQQRNIRGNHVALCQCGRAGIAKIVDSTSNYNMYKSRIERAIKNNDKQTLEEVKEAIMYAPTHKLSLQEQRELYNMIKNSGLNDSVKDSFAILHPKYYEFLSTGGRSWVKEDSTHIQKFATENEALEFGRKYVNGQFRLIKLVDSVKDAQSIMFRGENTFIFEEKDAIPEKVHYKEEVEIEGKVYHLLEGFDTKRKYLVRDSHTEELAQREYDKLKEQREKVENEIDKANPNTNMQQLANEIREIDKKLMKIKSMFKNIIEDELIESGSEEAFKKNIATEIRSGKSPEQAAAIAHSIKRKNDSKKFEVSYVKDGIEHIQIIKAKSLEDAISKIKEN